jgi:fragile X mental retardation protein
VECKFKKEIIIKAKCLFNFYLFFQMIKGDFHVVEYLGWENTYTEIVASERLRPKNSNTPIDKTTFYKFEIEVPEDLRE